MCQLFLKFYVLLFLLTQYLKKRDFSLAPSKSQYYHHYRVSLNMKYGFYFALSGG